MAGEGPPEPIAKTQGTRQETIHHYAQAKPRRLAESSRRRPGPECWLNDVACARVAWPAEQLPKALKDIEQVKKWQDHLKQTVATLRGEGIDDEVLEFLRELADGVPLANLLDNKKVMKWILDNNLTESFQVTSL